jgi:hypothetical protein
MDAMLTGMDGAAHTSAGDTKRGERERRPQEAYSWMNES